MSEQTPESAPGPLPLPDAPNIEWLRKQAKRRLAELRKIDRNAKLAAAQFDVATQYGFASWRALKGHVDSLTIDGSLFDAARKGDVDKLKALLDEHPDKLYARTEPHEHTMLHVAAQNGRLHAVEFLLSEKAKNITGTTKPPGLLLGGGRRSYRCRATIGRCGRGCHR